MTCTLKNSRLAKGMEGLSKPRRGKEEKGMDRYTLPQSSGHPAHSNSGAVKA